MSVRSTLAAAKEATARLVQTATVGNPMPFEHDDEPSELEVQRMLEARDRSGDADAPLVPVAPIREEESPRATESLQPLAQHPLDSAPVNSKIVATEEGAFLATPDKPGVTKLESPDRAAKLPMGARIQKIAEGQFLAQSIGSGDVRTKTYPTTAEAIADFLPFFHVPKAE